MTDSLDGIPFFDYARLYTDDAHHVRPAMDAVLQRGAFILQQEVETFEKRLAHFIDTRHVIAVANGTDALMLALRAAEIGQGDEVILPSHTYVASVAAIHYVGATPVLVECGPDHLVDPQAVNDAVTRKTRAIVPVQLNGRTADMDQITAIAEASDLLVIEDAAQAVGSRFRGKSAGTFGFAGAYSFYPAKLLGCFGDGGAVVTDHDEVAEKVRRLRDHGRDRSGRVRGWGVNSRLDTLQAAVLDSKLDRLPAMLEHRRRLARTYCDALGDIESLCLPPPPNADADHYDVYQNFEIEAERRDDLRQFLTARAIGTAVQWGGRPVHQIVELGIEAELPITDHLFERCILLPMSQFVSEQEAKVVATAIREFYEI